MTGRTVEKIIRDPVHEYISIYRDELPLLDSASIQRLRNVRQNGMAYFTYPALAVSRFEHSLGTMHLAGQMLSSALSKSDSSVVEEFLSFCADQCGWSKQEDVKEKLTKVVRAAGLLHDLGHLPFSHTLEEVIHNCADNILPKELMGRWKDYASTTQGSFHEFLTVFLIESDRQISQALGEDRDIVSQILQASPYDKSVFTTLHELISFDIDADRGDYLIRDGKSSGAEFGYYDVSRLVEGMRVVKPLGVGSFVIRPSIQALSAVESLIIERYKSYRWLYHHHRVIVTNRILEEIVWRLLGARWNNKLPLENIELAFPLSRPKVASGGKHGGTLEFCDDVDVFNTIRQAYRLLRNESAPDEQGGTIWYEHTELSALLEEILYRKKRGITFWKDIGDYRRFNEDVSSQIETVFGEHQSARYLQREGRMLPREEVRSTTEESDFALNWVAERLLGKSFAKRKALETEVNRELRRKRISGCLLLAVTFFKPWEYRGEREYEVVGRDGLLYHVSDVSPLIKQLRQINRSTVRFYAYFIPDKALEVLGSANLDKIKKEAQRTLANVLVKWVRGELKEQI